MDFTSVNFVANLVVVENFSVVDEVGVAVAIVDTLDVFVNSEVVTRLFGGEIINVDSLDDLVVEEVVTDFFNLVNIVGLQGVGIVPG